MRLNPALPLCAALALTAWIGTPAARADKPAEAPNAAFVALAPENADALMKVGAAGLDDPVSGRVPNYLRALAATHPNAVAPFAHLFRTVLYGGTVAPETKAAMGLHIARANQSPYLTAHLTRLLKTSEKGRSLLAAKNSAGTAEERDRIALRYAQDLTKAVHGVSDAEFAQARTVFNDAQLVELTAVTCFFNYFARFCQGAGLPLESWAQEAPNALPKPAPANDDLARVTLASDDELQTAVTLMNRSKELKSSLGIGIANSQRAMIRVADIGGAWWGYWQSVRADAKLQRPMQLQISFAVSMTNGCRYCVLHQVAGLRKVGVDPARLLSMKKDDSSLSPQEKSAVEFARKLTRTPGAMTAADMSALQAGLGGSQEAMDALLQTCAFNFMNRFTDGLRLPSEDEAVHVYQEVYGEGSYRAFPRNRENR